VYCSDLKEAWLKRILFIHQTCVYFRVESEGKFSFTSSLMGSLDQSDSDEPLSPGKKVIQHTEL